MNWLDFADADDVAARDFYSKLISAKAEARHEYDEGWLRVPRKIVHQVYHDNDQTQFWMGLEWVPIKRYESNGRIYIRLLNRDGV